jgi:uncharacterized repeat protein (TIGR01451 family)
MNYRSIKSLCFAALVLATCALMLVPTSQAQTFAEVNPGQLYLAEANWNEQYRADYEIPLGNYTGRSPYMRGTMQPEPPAPVVVPAPEPAPEPPPPPLRTACSDPTWGLIRMTKTMPAEAALGGEFEARLTVAAVACAGNVVVRDVIPAGASFVKSEPTIAVDDHTLVWRIGNLDAGQTVNARIWLRADKEGTLVNCATVTADPRVCASTFVGKATLTIEKTGPATARLGDSVTYNMVVRNTGNAVARNVVVTDPVPEGYSHPSGEPELAAALGDLAPGEAKALTATFKAIQRGKICNVATAKSANAGSVSDNACTVIQQPGLKVTKTGTQAQIIGRKADYQITVQNTGDADLANVSVVDTAPEGTTLVAAPEGNISGNRASWIIPNLPAGKSQSFSATVVGRMAGSLCNSVTASASGLSDSAQACTVWKGVPAVLLEVVDDPDPIQIGETTTYTIKVTNQGFATLHNITIVAVYDEETSPVSASYGTISGKTVDFPAQPTLEPKTVLTYTITIKGEKAGNSNNRVTMKCDEITTPVEETESTTVY